MKTIRLLSFFALLLSSASSWACNCLVNAAATGYDVNQVAATITHFSCTGEPITSATVNYWFNIGSCTSSNIKIIVNGSQVATGVCANGTFDLTPYLPLNSVSVVAFDTDAYSDSVSLEMNVLLTGQGGATNTVTDFMVPDFVCPGTPITPLNLSTCAHSYNWSINGPSINLNFYTHEPTFALPFQGNYNVALYTYDGNGYPLGSAFKSIQVFGPGSGIGLSADSICPGDVVSFTDYASYLPSNNVSYVIDYGDGSADSIQSSDAYFEHSYPTIGQYNVIMSIYSDCGYTQFDTTIYVTNNVVPFASLNLDYNSQYGVCPGTEVGFQVSFSQNSSFVINYGDGTNGSVTSHIYENEGTYYPTLTVQNACGNVSSANSAPLIVTQLNNYTGNTQINIEGSYGELPTFCPETPIDFHAPHAQSYEWQFGDGSTSTERDPNHSYAAPGQYNVSLKLTDGCGNQIITYAQVYITTTISVQNAGIDELPVQVCVSEPFYFRISSPSQYTSSGSVAWSFGDGTFSTEPQGYHAYSAPGNYTVQVTLTNGCGNDTTLISQITAGNNVPPNALMMIPQNSFCPGDEVLIVARPYSALNTFVWNLGNGDEIVAADSVVVTEEGMTHVYHYGTYVFNNPGTYTTTASITNACGQTASQQFTVNVSNGAQIADAGFLFQADNFICLNEEVVFRGYGGNDLYWNFGDGTGFQHSSEPLEAVYHSYDNAGSYLVRMIAKNSCGDTMMTSRYVTIPESKMNIITNSIDANCLQSNGTVIAYVAGPNPPYEYAWSCGQFTNVAQGVPAGIYVVNVTDSKGCTSFGIATVSDEEAPVIAVSNVVDVSCFGEDNGAIDITPIGNTAGITYQWSNGETSQDISGLVAGPYELIATNGQGCVSVASVQVDQPEEFQVSFSSTPSACGFSSGSASAIVTGSTGPYLYLWSNNQTGPTATGLAGGVYQVNIIDNEGCLTQNSIAISETNAPTIVVDSIDQVGCGAGGSGIYISPQGGSAPYSYQWSNGTSSQDISGLSPGQYFVKVSGSNGCFSTKIFDIDYQTPETDPVCIVTVTTSQNNKIAWEKQSVSDISYYNIYKESSEAGLYYNVGRVPYDSLSIFIDTISNPAVQSYRYKVSAVDNCGTESDVSSHHKTIHLTQNVGISGEVNLIWDSYEGFSYATYNILRYDNIDGWQQLTSLPSNVNSYSDYQAPMSTATSLHYLIEVVLDQACVSTKIENNNTTRSNRTEPIAGPIDVSGLDKLVRNNEIIVYPNPVSNQLNVRISIGNETNVKLLLLDGQGREVQANLLGEVTDGYEYELDVSEFATGIYSLWIISDGQRYQKRISIQK